MGLFNWLKKPKPNVDIKDEQPNSSNLYTQMEEVQPQKIQTIGNVVDCCEQMVEVNHQMQEMRQEYEVVTSYLTDIQKIERIPELEKEKIERAARNICVYTKEREKYKTKDSNLTNTQRSIMEKQENSIANELKNMKKNEIYNGVIKGDLQHLEGEKGVLRYEQEEIMAKQEFLKKMSIAMVVLVVSIIALLAAISLAFQKSMVIPYLLTIVMAALTETYIFLEENKNRKELKLLDRKRHKAIMLLNKVKIKYVNNMSLLEYSYEKYDVSSFAELEYIWKQYLGEKEKESKYAKHTDKINQAKEILLEELNEYQLFDREVWGHQALAIIDKREMVEVRHRLNVRRQKLRDNLDYNAKTYTKNKQEIFDFMDENKQMQEEIRDILRNYSLEL
ncbi:MAG: hypothetical protein ACERKN_08200 [Velocimicrobium sp.]